MAGGLPAGQGILYRLYERRLARGLDPAMLPHHVAMIIDGNRRWAKQLGQESAHGHRAGAVKVLEFLGWCDDLHLGVVTLYLLSSDNLVSRLADELAALCDIIAELAGEISVTRDWRVQHVGSSRGLPGSLSAALATAQERSAGRSGMHVNLAVGYGGRTEITDAIRSLIVSHAAEQRTLEELVERLSPELIGAHLYTGGQPDPDLVIRTSGEQRLSDFMLWQSAHSEFYFVEALGPDLRKVDFLRALRDFGRRARRYGA